MEGDSKRRIIITFFSFCFIFFIILGKAFKVQFIDKEELQKRSKGQILRESKVYPKRGSILDRNGNPLAININTYSIFTIPRNMKGDYSSFKELSKIVPKLSHASIKSKVKDRKRYTWLARKITLTKEQVVKVKALKGIYIESVPKRIYPNNELLGQGLGFVGIDNVGLSGIEYTFDKELRGSPRIVKYIKDAKGRPVKFESTASGDLSQDIQLTIDKDLQFIAEKALKEAVIEYNAIKGGIGVMDVRTGEILAMANYPTFDPNKLKGSRPKDRKLSFVTDPFEPGSTFKILTVASALEHKIARADTNYYCEEGEFKVGDHIISEAESKKKYQWLSMEEIIKYSSNVGTTKIAFDLTFPKLRETLRKFHIGQKTDIEIAGESRGIFTDETNISPLTLSNISFGQGVAVTGIQMLAAYAAIANGGVYNTPTLIKSKIKRKSHRVIEPDVAEDLVEMLIKAVEDGTGARAKIPYFTIAGKTSTAQRPNKNGGYSGYIPGFVGFPVNIENPFAIYVYVEAPESKKGYYGNLVAAPVFKKVAQHILYKRKDFKSIAFKKEKNDSFSDIVNMKKAATRYLGKLKVPNFMGLDKFSAMKLARKTNIKLDHRGIGVVTSQSIEVGSTVSESTKVTLNYTPPVYE